MAGLLPAFRRTDVVAGAREMRRQHLGFRLRHFGTIPAEHIGDAGVDLAALALQHAFIGSVLEQRVAERVAAGRTRILEHHIDRHQPVEIGLQVVLSAIQRRSKEIDRKLATVGRRDLRNFLGRTQPVEPLRQRVAQRSRDLDAPVMGRPGSLDDRVGQLLDEEWDSVALGDDVVGDLGRETQSAGQERIDDRPCVAPPSRLNDSSPTLACCAHGGTNSGR